MKSIRLNYLPLFLLFMLTSVALTPFHISAQNQDDIPDSGDHNPIEVEELFFAANSYYRDKNYNQALDNYLLIENEGIHTADLFYNIANCYFRLGHIGYSVYYYEKAMLLDPNDPDILYNRNYLNKFLKDDITSNQPTPNILFFWTGALSLQSWMLWFLLLNLIFWALIATRHFSNNDIIKYAFYTTLLLWLFFGISLSGRAWIQFAENRAIVLRDEINVLSGPFQEETVLFQLHAGSTVYHIKDDSDYSLIALPDGKRGWVHKSDTGLIKSYL